MATFRSTQMGGGNITGPTTNAPFPVSGPGIGGRSIKVERAEVNLANTGALAAADVVQLFKLHPRFRVTGGFVKITGGMGASVTYTVGDAADADRYFVSASGASAAINTTVDAAGLDYLTTAYTIVTMTIAGATTNATGVVVVELHGFVEEPA